MQFLRWLGKSLVRQILFAMLLGILIGYTMLKSNTPQAAEYFQILGEFFTKALRAVAPILVFVLITHAISRHQQGQARGLKTIIALYVVGTFLAAAVAVVASTWYPTALQLSGNPEAVTAPGSLKEVLVTLLFKITDNPVNAAANGNYIGILTWSILAGIVMRHASDVSKTVLDDAARVIHYVVSLVIRIAPYGVFGLVTATGKFKQIDPSAEDGSQVAAGVLLQTCDATLIDRDDGLVVARHAIVAHHALAWPDAITTAEKLTAIAQLKALSVLVRQGA